VRTYLRRGLAVAAVAVVALGVSACGKASDSGGSGNSGSVSVSKGFKIGVLLPENKTARYEKFDLPYLKQDIHKLCPKCEVLYRNALQNSDTQRQQVDSVLAAGAKVLILDAVDYKAIGASIDKAQGQGVPVVAYDRLATGKVSGYSSFNNVDIGKLQGKAFLQGLEKGGNPKRGQVILVNGSPDDPNAPDFKKGMHSVLDGHINKGAEYDTQDWSPDKARQEVAGAIQKIGASNVIGVYCANDGMAGGAVAALKAAGITNAVVTGQDAELDGLQRILTGDQYATIYKAIKPEAEAAAEQAVDVAQGKKWNGANKTTVNNGDVTVPAAILPATTVTKDNIKSTVVADGYWKVSEICTAKYVSACKQAGLE
jgi:D-xylose transport system substrate-binding protein